MGVAGTGKTWVTWVENEVSFPVGFGSRAHSVVDISDEDDKSTASFGYQYVQ